MSLSATFASPITFSTSSVARSEDQRLKQKKNVCFVPAGLQPLHLHFQPFRNSASPIFRVKRASICAASLNATCAAQQTQTVTRQSSTVAPIQWKEKFPELDDGGTRFPPRDEDGGVGGRGGGGDGGGGRRGGGGAEQWSGGFLFFSFLVFLSFLKDQESEEPYLEERRRCRDY